MDRSLEDEVVLWERECKIVDVGGITFHKIRRANMPPHCENLIRRITSIELISSSFCTSFVTELYGLRNLERVVVYDGGCAEEDPIVEWSRFPNLKKLFFDSTEEIPHQLLHFDNRLGLQIVCVDGPGSGQALPSILAVTSLVQLSIHATEMTEPNDWDFSLLTELTGLYLVGVCTKLPRGLHAMRNLVELVLKDFPHTEPHMVVLRDLEETAISDLTIRFPSATMEWDIGHLPFLANCTLRATNAVEIMEGIIHSAPELIRFSA